MNLTNPSNVRTVGDDMNALSEMINNLSGGDPDNALKLLALVAAQYALGMGCTEFDVQSRGLKVTVGISEVDQGRTECTR